MRVVEELDVLTTLGVTTPERVVGRPCPWRHQATSAASYFGRTQASARLTYVDQVSRAWLFFTKYGLDLLIVLAAVASAVGTALRDDPEHPTGPMLWFEVLAVAGVVLTLLARRRFPFAAPAATWLSGAALSFVDGLLIVDQGGLFVAGMGAALLLGNLRRDAQARVGLAIVLGSAAIVIYNDPDHAPGDLVFTPVLFAIGWLVGFALRERDRADRGRRGARDPGREGTGGGGPGCGGRGARTDRTRAPRRRRARRQRDGAPGGRGPTPDARDRHGGSRDAQERRAGGPHRTRGDASPAQRDAT